MILCNSVGVVGHGKFCKTVPPLSLWTPIFNEDGSWALKYLFSFKDPQGQMTRWVQVLDTYDFEIEHRAHSIRIIYLIITKLENYFCQGYFYNISKFQEGVHHLC